MAITDYGTLKTAVGSYLNRSDLTSYIPDFIRLGERRLFYGSDAPNPSVPVRVPAMQNRTSGSVSGGSISFPTGFLEIIRLRLASGATYWTADYAPPNRFTELEMSSDTPSHYTFLNNAIKLPETGAADYVLDYYKAFDNLTGDSDTNWLLTNAPDSYLFAALMESSPFLSDMDMLIPWAGMYRSIVSSLNRTTNKAPGGALYVRPIGSETP